MTNRFMVSVAALALIAGTGVATAQGTRGEAGGSSMQHSAPAGNSAASKSDSSSGTSKSEQSEQKSSGAMKNDRAEDNVKGGSTSQRAEDRGKAGTTNQHAEDNMKSGNKAESRDSNMKAEGRDRDHDKNMKAEGRDSKSGTNAAESKSTTSQTTTGQAGAGAKLTTEQRTKITSVIRNEHVAPMNNVNFSISVGTRVPREGVTLHRLPSEVVSVYPEWRSYEYILVHDQIVVIDPGTYEIVAVLDT